MDQKADRKFNLNAGQVQSAKTIQELADALNNVYDEDINLYEREGL